MLAQHETGSSIDVSEHVTFRLTAKPLLSNLYSLN